MITARRYGGTYSGSAARYSQARSMKRGLYLAPFGELANPRLLTDLARTAEFRRLGRLVFLGSDRLSASGTRRGRPVGGARRHRLRDGHPSTRADDHPGVPQARAEVARGTVTLDHLSNGRLTLGVGLGNADDLEPFGEVIDARERGRLLDEGLERLGGFWSGGFRPLPVQRPRIPVWVVANWPNRRPVRRAIRWDGLFPIDLPGPEGLAELVEEVQQARAGSDDPFDLVVEVPPGADVHAWEAAGATWGSPASSRNHQRPRSVR